MFLERDNGGPNAATQAAQVASRTTILSTLALPQCAPLFSADFFYFLRVEQTNINKKRQEKHSLCRFNVKFRVKCQLWPEKYGLSLHLLDVFV